MADTNGTYRVQYAALPYRVRQDGEVQLRLVTSRETRRWVIPKGWPMKGIPPHKAAAREAYEEAGLLGSIASTPIGIYRYDKRLSLTRSVLCEVMVFPMKVKRYLKKWPERSQRVGFWFSIETAASVVQEPELASLILEFGAVMAERHAEKLAKAGGAKAGGGKTAGGKTAGAAGAAEKKNAAPKKAAPKKAKGAEAGLAATVPMPAEADMAPLEAPQTPAADTPVGKTLGAETSGTEQAASKKVRAKKGASGTAAEAARAVSEKPLAETVEPGGAVAGPDEDASVKSALKKLAPKKPSPETAAPEKVPPKNAAAKKAALKKAALKKATLKTAARKEAGPETAVDALGEPHGPDEDVAAPADAGIAEAVEPATPAKAKAKAKVKAKAKAKARSGSTSGARLVPEGQTEVMVADAPEPTLPVTDGEVQLAPAQVASDEPGPPPAPAKKASAKKAVTKKAPAKKAVAKKPATMEAASKKAANKAAPKKSVTGPA